jgi:hypothetical protein
MNNNIEILDIYEQEKLELRKFYDKLLFNITYVVGILLPIFFFVFIVSLNSNVLIRKKIGILSGVISSFIFIFLLYILITKYKKIKINNTFIKFSLYYLVVLSTLFFLYQKNSWLKKYILEETRYTPKYQIIAKWLYNN